METRSPYLSAHRPLVGPHRRPGLGATACSGNDGGRQQTSSVKGRPQEGHDRSRRRPQAHAAGDLTGVADYKTTLKYDPDNKFAFYNLALIDASNGNYGLAEGNYRSAIKPMRRYEPALFNLAILRTSADPKEAKALYHRAVAADKKTLRPG
jgi:hypothetical protein